MSSLFLVPIGFNIWLKVQAGLPGNCRLHRNPLPVCAVPDRRGS